MIKSLKNMQKNPSSNTVYGWNSELLLVYPCLSHHLRCSVLWTHMISGPPPAKMIFQGCLFHRLRFCWEVSFQRVRNLVPSSCNQPESWPCKLSKWCAIFQWGLLWLGFSNEDQNVPKKTVWPQGVAFLSLKVTVTMCFFFGCHSRWDKKIEWSGWGHKE